MVIAPAVDVVEARQEIDERRLARAAAADERHDLARRDRRDRRRAAPARRRT